MRVRIRPILIGCSQYYRVETKSGWFWLDTWSYAACFDSYEEAEKAAEFLKQDPVEIN